MLKNYFKVKYIYIIAVVLFLSACNNNPGDGFITVKVNQVEQVGSYTYLLVKEKGQAQEYWIAVSSMVAMPGETYKYMGGLLMEDFYSKDLDRTFDAVLFLDKIISENGSAKQVMEERTPGSMVTNEKSDIKIASIEGTVSIAELYADPAAYRGKTIQVKGEVTKVNMAIMERNWLHLQDGTEHDGKYDLTITTSEVFEVGSTVIIEGVLALDKDFGYGYSYELLLEKARTVK